MPLDLDLGLFLTTSLPSLCLQWYNDANGVERLIVSTQFEASSARRAFPCLDEPALKATYDVSITNGPQYPTVLSNQEQLSQTVGPNGWLTTVFDRTPVMSSYLLAWVVSAYVNETRIARCNGKDVRSSVWVPRELKNSSYVSSYLAAHQIEYFCQYYQYDYPLSKQDHVYIPQFAAGAMENWGLITYRDNASQPHTHTGRRCTRGKRACGCTDLWHVYCRCARSPLGPQHQHHRATAARRTRHLARVGASMVGRFTPPTTPSMQILFLTPLAWSRRRALPCVRFGNLVTASWWSQLWLNEGFARFMQFFAGDAVSPELLLTDQFITVAQRQALVTDSSRNTHPVVNEESLNSLSDIIYAKGASVLRMIVALIGAPVWENGIRSYLKQYQYSSTVTTDLFAVLDQAVKNGGGTTDVTEIMREWTTVAGYPLVTCDAATQAGGSYVWTCDQKRFYSYDEPQPATSTWTIPLTLSTPTPITVPNLLWPAGQRTFTFTLPSTPAFVKLNTNTTGFYRVNYSPQLWNRLGQGPLSSTPQADRAPEHSAGHISDPMPSLTCISSVRSRQLSFSPASAVSTTTTGWVSSTICTCSWTGVWQPRRRC